MTRVKFATWAMVVSAAMVTSIQAQDQDGPNSIPSLPPLVPAVASEQQMPTQSPEGLPQSVSFNSAQGLHVPHAPMPVDANIGSGGVVPAPQAGYVRLGAPMYPTPRPNIPIWTGSTVITNQAFAPQEMLYPHTYRAIYPPFYHRVKGGWIVTPFGVRSHERWELQGTQVQVKYRSSYPGILSGAAWHPTASSTTHGAWR